MAPLSTTNSTEVLSALTMAVIGGLFVLAGWGLAHTMPRPITMLARAVAWFGALLIAGSTLALVQVDRGVHERLGQIGALLISAAGCLILVIWSAASRSGRLGYLLASGSVLVSLVVSLLGAILGWPELLGEAIRIMASVAVVGTGVGLVWQVRNRGNRGVDAE